MLQQCQEVAASLSDEYHPLMWQFYKSHRRAVFELARSLSIRSTTQDQSLVHALTLILSQENRRSLFLPETLDLSFAPEVWQHLVRVKRRKRTKLVRRHLEVCIFTAVADELKAGDLAVEGSEQFADYRAQLLPWETCEPQVADYCQEIGLPADAHTFVAQLRERLTDVAAQVDAAFPGINPSRLPPKATPRSSGSRQKQFPQAALPFRRLSVSTCQINPSWIFFGIRMRTFTGPGILGPFPVPIPNCPILPNAM